MYRDIYHTIGISHRDNNISEQAKQDITLKCSRFLKAIQEVSDQDSQGVRYFIMHQLQHILAPLAQISQLIQEKDTVTDMVKSILEGQISERLKSEDISQGIENIYLFYPSFQQIFENQKKDTKSFQQDIEAIVSSCNMLELELTGEFPKTFDTAIFFIFFQNLISNYKKYGKEGKLTIKFEEKSYSMVLENTKTSLEKASQMYSG